VVRASPGEPATRAHTGLLSSKPQRWKIYEDVPEGEISLAHGLVILLASLRLFLTQDSPCFFVCCLPDSEPSHDIPSPNHHAGAPESPVSEKRPPRRAAAKVASRKLGPPQITTDEWNSYLAKFEDPPQSSTFSVPAKPTTMSTTSTVPTNTSSLARKVVQAPVEKKLLPVENPLARKRALDQVETEHAAKKIALGSGISLQPRKALGILDHNTHHNVMHADLKKATTILKPAPVPSRTPGVTNFCPVIPPPSQVLHLMGFAFL